MPRDAALREHAGPANQQTQDSDPRKCGRTGIVTEPVQTGAGWRRQAGGLPNMPQVGIDVGIVGAQ